MDLAPVELELHLHQRSPAMFYTGVRLKPFAGGAGLHGSQAEVLTSVPECKLCAA